ncbi:MAG TPA: hypothetical protein VGW40_08630 [Allosphingosinicella sp.]|nr:hypothetical protein [Allosphingosinicella sp.]
MARRAALVVALVLLVFAAPARADSWFPPHRTTYYSANRAARLIVTPHVPADQRQRPYGGEVRGPSAADAAHGLLQRRAGRGRWIRQWEGPLRNEVMPVAALVADSGRYFVTFDDWGGTGTGPNVVVIYDGAGRVIRALSLPDLVSEDYARSLWHSFASIFWGGEHRISADGESLVLDVASPEDELYQGGGPLTLEVALATGRVTPPAGPAWETALAASARVRAQQRAWAARRLAYMTDPLLGPVDGDRNAWEQYLTEAYYRLFPGPVHPTGWSLSRPGSPRYAEDRNFVASILRSPLHPDVAVLLASPDEEDLIGFLGESLARIPPGAWRGNSLYVAAHDANWPRIAALIEPTGATPVQIDPTEPIAQLPERLRIYRETGASGALTPEESRED